MISDESSEGEAVPERLKPGMVTGQRHSAKVTIYLSFLSFLSLVMTACGYSLLPAPAGDTEGKW